LFFHHRVNRKKYLVPADLTMGQFVYVIRKASKGEPELGWAELICGRQSQMVAHFRFQRYVFS